MFKPELLAPAGNLSKLKVVLHFGADAAYIGGKNYSLRSYADNFTDEELLEGINYAHNLGKKVYVTVNIFAKNADMDKAKDYFIYLQKIGADAVLITDPGLAEICKQYAPNLVRHLSTQANTLNKYAADFWRKQGFARVVLARELGIKDIQEIHNYTDVELETFVHGAMCISYSGRCLLSNYLAHRDGNRGECVQACRWNYKLTDTSKFPHPPVEVEEDERGTYFLNSKDLNLLSDIPALAEAGVVSFKVEGRMKSEYYIATVINAYRRAIDEYAKDGKIVNLDLYEKELRKISHRTYTKAYFDGDNPETVSYEDERNVGDSEFVAIIMDYNDGTAYVEMRNRFAIGDALEILSPTDSFNKTFEVTEIKTENGENIDDAKYVQQRLYVKIPYIVSAGDILRRVAK